ncbi:MAG TPA: Sir2 family NAD-dependent protein deacetylase [Syntrophomonadaceae bacterium]|nr:Sir2 family NAD-dependent protein deacetylase [Syntrophomonadaceae bacterium]
MSLDVLVDKVLMHPRPWILTGAGISTESGIPDFRSADGLWEKVDPIENFSTWALYNNPEGFYTHGIPLFKQVLEANPNLGHIILGELQTKRFFGPIITQNVDSLHQKGGAKWVYEIHGHLRTATCISCHKTVVTLDELFKLVEDKEIPPKCQCGGILKPDVILFGDTMPEDFQDAIRLIRSYRTTDNMIITIGSSLTVSPINTFPSEFDSLAIINKSVTILDRDAEIIIKGSAGAIMQKIRARLVELNNGEELVSLPAGFLPGRLTTIILDLWESFLTKKKTFNRGEQLNKIMADLLLVEKLFLNYPRMDKRSGIEKYMINSNLIKLQKIKNEMIEMRGNAKNTNGYMPRSINDIINSHYKALIIYTRQYNSEPEIVKELVLQIVGFIGLYKHMEILDMQEFENSFVDELYDKILKITNKYELDIDMVKALDNY